MCLTVESNQKLLTAKKDITCYKFVKITNKELTTPFQFSVVELGKTYESNIGQYRNRIDMGIHSFVSLKVIRIYVPRFARIITKLQDYRIVECIIPKGSKYIKGIFNSGILDNIASYASDKIIYRTFLD